MKSDFSRFQQMADLNSMSASSQEGTVLLLDPNEIRVVEQIRTVFKGIEELAETMKVEQQTPIIVSPLDKNTNTYLLQKGERRWRAAKLIGNGFKLKAIVDSTARTVSQAIASQMRENVQREDFTPLETARGLVKLRAEMQAEGKKGTGRELAAEMGKPESWVSKHLDLADIPDELTALILDDVTSDAELIQSLKKIFEIDLERFQSLIAKARSEVGLSRSEAREALKIARGGPPPKSTENSPDGGAIERTAPQIPGQQSGLNTTGVQSSSLIEGGGQGNTPDGKEPNNLQEPGAENISHAKTSGGSETSQTKIQVDPSPQGGKQPAAKPPAKKLGKTEIIEIPADQMVIQVRVSTDKKQITGELLTTFVCGDRNKGMVSHLDGGKQHKTLFDLDRIEIISLAQLALDD